MWNCPICFKEYNDRISNCTYCGYDKTTDIEKYPSLQPVNLKTYETYRVKAALFYETEGKKQIQSLVNILNNQIWAKYDSAVRSLVKAESAAYFRQLEKVFREFGDFANSRQYAEFCSRSVYRLEKEERYDVAVHAMAVALTALDYRKCAELFKKLGDYKDAQKLENLCRMKSAEQKIADKSEPTDKPVNPDSKQKNDSKSYINESAAKTDLKDKNRYTVKTDNKQKNTSATKEKQKTVKKPSAVIPVISSLVLLGLSLFAEAPVVTGIAVLSLVAIAAKWEFIACISVAFTGILAVGSLSVFLDFFPGSFVLLLCSFVFGIFAGKKAEQYVAYKKAQKKNGTVK